MVFRRAVGFTILVISPFLSSCFLFRSSESNLSQSQRYINRLMGKAGDIDYRSGANPSLGRAISYVGNLTWPVDSDRRFSGFGWRSNSFHEGIDIAAASGAPVYAAHDGLVVFAGRGLNGYGRMIALEGSGLLTIYAHNSSIEVSEGDWVEAGQYIADVGESGNASGPHLHFETRIIEGGRSIAVDPGLFFKRRSTRS